jgi:integrase
VAQLSPARASECYDEAATLPKHRGRVVDCATDAEVPEGFVKVECDDGRFQLIETISVDTHRNMLLEARSFLRWCKEDRKWTHINALEGVKGKGKRSHGKDQLRINEARKWCDLALERAHAGDEGALGALLTLMMALSGTEITERRVRDLDDDGTILWVEDGKTEARNAPVEVPDELRELLRAQAKGKDALGYLFPAAGGGAHWRDWPAENVRRICRLAKVPEVCGHSMRGLHATVSYERGATGRLVADGLRHGHESVSKQSYATEESVRKGQQDRALRVIRGGRRG